MTISPCPLFSYLAPGHSRSKQDALYVTYTGLVTSVTDTSQGERADVTQGTGGGRLTQNVGEHGSAQRDFG